MRSSLLTITLFSVVFFISCGEDTPPAEQKKDSTVPGTDTISNTVTVREVQTDSGKLVITHRDGQEVEDVVLMSAEGKILARGQFFNNRPSGAWLKYDTQGNVATAVRFSDGVAMNNLDVDDFKTERVEMKEMGISFVKPQQWDTVHPYNAATFVSYEKPIADQDVKMKPNINISKGILEPGQTVESLAADMLNLLHSQVGRVELIDEAYLTIDSCKSFRRYGMYYTEENKVGFLDAIIVSGGNVYVISCAAQNNTEGEFLNYQAVFEGLVMSVEIQ